MYLCHCLRTVQCILVTSISLHSLIFNNYSTRRYIEDIKKYPFQTCELMRDEEPENQQNEIIFSYSCCIGLTGIDENCTSLQFPPTKANIQSVERAPSKNPECRLEDHELLLILRVVMKSSQQHTCSHTHVIS